MHERNQLRETRSTNYKKRTRLNVRDSDGTAKFSKSPLNGGTKLTMELARELGKPVVHIEKACYDAAQELSQFVAVYDIKVLNVAGPRASGDSEIYGFVQRVLTDCFLGGAAT